MTNKTSKAAALSKAFAKLSPGEMRRALKAVKAAEVNAGNGTANKKPQQGLKQQQQKQKQKQQSPAAKTAAKNKAAREVQLAAKRAPSHSIPAASGTKGSTANKKQGKQVLQAVKVTPKKAANMAGGKANKKQPQQQHAPAVSVQSKKKVGGSPAGKVKAGKGKAKAVKAEASKAKTAKGQAAKVKKMVNAQKKQAAAASGEKTSKKSKGNKKTVAKEEKVNPDADTLDSQIAEYWFMAGKGPDPKLVKLEKDMESYWAKKPQESDAVAAESSAVDADADDITESVAEVGQSASEEEPLTLEQGGDEPVAEEQQTA